VRGDYHLALWTAIRAGWRHGYSAVVELPADSTREAVRDLAAFSTFVVGGGLEAVERTHTYIREARSALKINRPFELAVALDSSDGLADFLEWLKSRNHAAQIAMLPLAGCSEDAIRGLAEVCRQNQCALGASEELEIVARVTGGRATFWVDEVPRSLLG
jgi:thiamine monophosphate kinase